jgi:hypothetical protein
LRLLLPGTGGVDEGGVEGPPGLGGLPFYTLHTRSHGVLYVFWRPPFGCRVSPPCHDLPAPCTDVHGLHLASCNLALPLLALLLASLALSSSCSRRSYLAHSCSHSMRIYAPPELFRCGLRALATLLHVVCMLSTKLPPSKPTCCSFPRSTLSLMVRVPPATVHLCLVLWLTVALMAPAARLKLISRDKSKLQVSGVWSPDSNDSACLPQNKSRGCYASR